MLDRLDDQSGEISKLGYSARACECSHACLHRRFCEISRGHGGRRWNKIESKLNQANKAYICWPSTEGLAYNVVGRWWCVPKATLSNSMQRFSLTQDRTKVCAASHGTIPLIGFHL
jgi:hypothetical protein